MKYIILTSRHHDGFSLWDSQFTEYDMANTPYGKGVVEALADESRKQGIDFGVYYSICDWRHADYPVKYPDPEYQFHQEKDITDPAVKAQMDRFIVFVKNQLRELVEDYDVSFLWFDGEWEWAWTHEMGMDLYAYLRGLKDDLADGRIEQRQIDRLKEMGNWLKINEEAVYGTRGGPYKPTDYMVSTRVGNKIYLHLLSHPGANLHLPFPSEIKMNKAYFLQGIADLKVSQDKESIDISLPDSLPDEIASVIVLELNKPALDIAVMERLRY